MVKLLHSEACSSIWFSLAGEVRIGDIAIPEGVVVLPVEKVAAQVSLAPGSELAGIRFQPAIGYGLIRQHFGRPMVLTRDPRQLPGLIPLFSRLKTCCNNVSRVSTMQSWAENNFRLTRLIPGALQQALDCIRDDAEPGSLTQHLEVSQRHVERLFKHWMEMTPKQYQRILRVKRAINYIREHGQVNLAEIAHQFGFSDQAHMTREFRTIARITPGKV
ncbi:AraC family transcriptional regulator [Marinobacter sp. EN3]|uniref:helix-turn-helix domain-containing protein n=1 Tax=Marinobacter sp. EN3 TaxID=1397533 RepID=UPI0003B7F232|nr:helix-turn-helix domain-containing protein [Marinobacter sp. EN3]ERS10319.1 AraC family transcriptional regulator [Marinobacter sp. EN3]